MLKKKACGTLVGESGETVIRDVLFDGRSEELSLEVMGQGRTCSVQSPHATQRVALEGKCPKDLR